MNFNTVYFIGLILLARNFLQAVKCGKRNKSVTVIIKCHLLALWLEVRRLEQTS